MGTDILQKEIRPESHLATDGSARASLGRGPLHGLIRLSRPWHWVKNIFVLLPLPFAVADQLQHGELNFQFLPLAIGLVGFCLVNSAVYALNDVVDAEADRLHSHKKDRPVASGDVSSSLALAWAIVVLAAGIGLGWLTWRPHVL